MSARTRVHRALALSTLLFGTALASAQEHFAPVDCIDSATSLEINRLLRTGGEGTAVVLCPYAHVSIDSHGQPITFTAPRQAIYTKGFPEDHSRATLVIENPEGHYSGELTTAISAACEACRGAQIRNLHVDGGREQLGGLEGTDALIVVGGDGGAHEVRNVDAWGARGYAVMHAAEGKKGTCRDVVISGNVVHTAGDAPLDAFLQSELLRLRDGPPAYLGQERPGTWTDGISVACAHSTISENTVRDVSGIGIAVRGSPGSQIFQNSIVARDRDMLAGISLVANPVFRGKASELGGVTVRENRIHAASAMIRVGIATGAGAWATDELAGSHEIPFASEIVRNRLSSYTGYFGYAIALSDARNLVVQDNAISASIWGFETSACYDRPAFVPPSPLIRDPRSVVGTLQPSFTDKHFGFLLCVGPGSASSSFEMSRHQINDAQARNFHAALSRSAGSAGAGAGAASGGRTTRARGRPAAIPLQELHPHPDGAAAVADAAAQAVRGALRGRVAAVAAAHYRGGEAGAARKRRYPAEAAAAAAAAGQESDLPRRGMQRARLRAPRAVGGLAGMKAVHARDKYREVY